MSLQDHGPLPPLTRSPFPVRGEGFFVRGILLVFGGGWGALPSPGGEGAELARRKGAMGSLRSMA